VTSYSIVAHTQLFVKTENRGKVVASNHTLCGSTHPKLSKEASETSEASFLCAEGYVLVSI